MKLVACFAVALLATATKVSLDDDLIFISLYSAEANLTERKRENKILARNDGIVYSFRFFLIRLLISTLGRSTGNVYRYI